MIITTTDSSNESVTVGLLGCASEITSHGNCSAFSGCPNDRLSPTNSFLRTHSDGRPGASPPHRGTIPVPLSSSAPDIASRCVRGASVNDLCSFWRGQCFPRRHQCSTHGGKMQAECQQFWVIFPPSQRASQSLPPQSAILLSKSPVRDFSTVKPGPTASAPA